MTESFLTKWERVIKSTPRMDGRGDDWPEIPAPFLTADLEDLAEKGTFAPHEWNAQALEELARQLGVANDYYYPLIGAAQEMRRLVQRGNQSLATEKPDGHR